MGKVGLFQVLGWANTVKNEINNAYGEDKQIDAGELLVLFKNLATKIELPVDHKSQKYLDLIVDITTEIEHVTEDNKISIGEIITIADKLCEKFGYDLDTQGFDIELSEIKLGGVKPEKVVENVEVER